MLIDWKTAADDTKVCYCSDVDLATIKRAIENGARSITDIQSATCASTGGKCEELNPSGGCCATDIAKIISIFSKDGLVMGESGKPGTKPAGRRKRKKTAKK